MKNLVIFPLANGDIIMMIIKNKIIQNIVKYTFYCDRKRKEKEYYLLAIFQELLKTNDEEIRENILDLKNKSKSLYQLVLMSIALINSSFGSYKKGLKYYLLIYWYIYYYFYH